MLNGLIDDVYKAANEIEFSFMEYQEHYHNYYNKMLTEISQISALIESYRINEITECFRQKIDDFKSMHDAEQEFICCYVEFLRKVADDLSIAEIPGLISD